MQSEKMCVVLLFGGMSSEHEVSRVSVGNFVNNIDREKYETLAVGITKEGRWLYTEATAAQMADGSWEELAGNMPCVISPDRADHGMILFTPEGHVEKVHVDVVIPVLHGLWGEDGTVQGLLELAGIPYVGCGVLASAVCMDKTLTKLVADHAGIRQAAWELVNASALRGDCTRLLERLEARFAYPMFVKPAGTGSSVGVSKALDRAALERALRDAAKFDKKVLVEEFIDGQEVEVAVLGNDAPAASVCGEIVAGADFYDYEAKYISDCAKLVIPARLDETVSERVRDTAIRAYRALGCRGLSRVDFFVTRKDREVVFNEINTIPGFTSISMYPKLFEASGIPYPELLDRLIELAMEA